ncbi:MAG: hypothetical protein JWR77_34 [Rhizorhabdus sp.]|nr:hypothetical protein [Rhizorhabdus sp.]
MTSVQNLNVLPRMASRWRRRRFCVLRAAERQTTAALRDISGSGAWLETRDPPALGAVVELQHPDAGSIMARVSGVALDGVRLSFDGDEHAVAFALGAIVHDMTRAD